MKNKPHNPAKPPPAPHESVEVIEIATGKRRRLPVDPRVGQSVERWLSKRVDGNPQFRLAPEGA